MQAFEPCPTCGLSLPPHSASAYCTRYCAKARHRYPRAQVTLRELITAARKSEEMDRADLAEREWHAVEIWRGRLRSMQEHIVAARQQAGLPVDAWPSPTVEEIEGVA
jgi:hypothetical protein